MTVKRLLVLLCMEKYMKFTMYEKTVKNTDYREDPFRAVNFKRNEDGQLVCPNGKAFTHYADTPIRGNKYGRTEEMHICEDCTNCPYRQKCYKGKGDQRVIRLNRELTQFHEEVLRNLESVHGALLRMNRSIQAEGTYGIMKWDRSYKRAFRRGLESVILEFTMISCGFNLYKYHNKKTKLRYSVISQILCKHRFWCTTEQNIFKAGAAQAAAALSTK